MADINKPGESINHSDNNSSDGALSDHRPKKLM